jgi:tetratricopeptide (TPR) repeat protein
VAAAAVCAAVLLGAAVRVAAAPVPEVEAPLVDFDRVYMKGVPDPIEGTVVEETADGVRFQRKGSMVPYVIAKTDIDHVVRADKPERVYEERSRRLGADDVAGRVALARFCLKHGLDLQAAREASLAAAAAGSNPAARESAVEAYRLLSLARRARYAKVSPDFYADVRDQELDAYERADAAGALPPDLRLAKARLLRDCGDRDAALAELEKLVAAMPPTRTADGAPAPPAPGEDLDRVVRLELGDLALAIGRLDKAEEAYRALGDGEARALEGLGLCAFARGDLAQAAARFDAAAAADPDGADYAIERGIVAFHAGDLDAAEQAFAKAEMKSVSRPELLLYEGLLAAVHGKVKRAEALLARAAAPPADGAPARLLGCETLLARGLVLEISGRSAEAIARYAEALGVAAEKDAAGPRGPSGVTAPLAGLAALMGAQAHGARGEAPLAEEALKEAARQGYDFPTIAAEIARARRDVRDFATAVRYSRYAAARRPEDPDILAGLGRSYLGAKELDEAEASFDAALALAPENVDATLGKARILYGRGEFAAAEGLFRHALELDPESRYASLALRRIAEAHERRVWRDDFHRADAQDVKNRWEEEERFGIEAAIRGRRLVFSGRQASEDMGITRVRRPVDGARLAEFRVRLEAAAAGPARVGIRLESREGGEIAFFRAPDDSLAYVARPPNRDFGDPQRAGSWPREAGPHELWFAVGGPDRGEIVFGVDQDETARVKLPGFGKATSFACSIYVQAPLGAPVDVAASEARIYIVKEKRAGKAGGY